MKLLLIKLSLVFLIFNTVSANTLDTYLTLNRFYQNESKQHYIEVSFLVPAGMVNFAQNPNSKYQAKLRVKMLVSNSTKIVSSKEYILQTNEYPNINSFFPDLKDVVRLFVPEKDTLIFSCSLVDVNDTSLKFETKIDVYIPETKDAFLSDIMLVNNVNENNSTSVFSRNNMELIPKFLNYYPTEISRINFYNEFYQPNKKEDYFVRYLLTDEEGIYIDGYASYKRIEAKPYEVIISGFNIEKLPSGNYYMYIELKDSKNNIVELKRRFFQRNNKNKDIVVENIHTQKNELEVITHNFARKYNLANIKHHIQALKPIAGYFEKSTIESFEKSEDLVQMQNYFFSFWKAKNKTNPEAEWMAYAEKLKYVEDTYTTMNERGFQTPMGIVYLIYGEPFYKRLHRKKGQKEFWVWNYEELKGQGNVYFIFQNFDNITDDFRLVHTSLKGELFDKKWAEFIKNEL